LAAPGPCVEGRRAQETNMAPARPLSCRIDVNMIGLAAPTVAPAVSVRRAHRRVSVCAGKYNVCTLSGDGIGPEIMDVAVKCLEVRIAAVPTGPAGPATSSMDFSRTNGHARQYTSPPRDLRQLVYISDTRLRTQRRTRPRIAGCWGQGGRHLQLHARAHRRCCHRRHVSEPSCNARRPPVAGRRRTARPRERRTGRTQQDKPPPRPGPAAHRSPPPPPPPPRPPPPPPPPGPPPAATPSPPRPRPPPRLPTPSSSPPSAGTSGTRCPRPSAPRRASSGSARP